MTSQCPMTFQLVVTVFLICIGSSFLMGYSMAILNNPTDFLKKFLESTVLSGGNSTGAPSIDFLLSSCNAIYVVGAAMGAFSCGLIADSLGRRNGVLVNHLFVIGGAVMVGPCVVAKSPVMLYVGRFLSGINSGMTIGLASMYLTEIAPRHLRGTIGACHQLAVTVGICFAYLFTMTWSLNTADLWPVAVAISAVPALISLCILPFFPESPRFLFLRKKDEAGTRKAIQRFDKNTDVDVVIGELRAEIEASRQQPEFKFKQLFVQRDLRMPIILACLIQVLQQLSGINAMIAYSSIMFERAGVEEDYKQYCVLGIGILNVVVTMISLPLLERLGRRSLLLWPALVLGGTLLLMTIVVEVNNSMNPGATKKALAALSVALIFIYICSFALGLGPVPGLIVSEIFRQGPRASAYSLSQGIQWLSNLIVLISYPSMDNKIGGYSFLIFLVVVIIGWIVFFLFMPETKNKTFDEVATDLAFGNIVVGKKTARIEEQPLTEKSTTTPQSTSGAANVTDQATEQLLPKDANTVKI